MAPPTGPIPPPLPPSVEESYRRKCIQLKQRMNEVEEANDASRVRLNRMKRGIEKLRLERAFLLEQLAKRTSTNVEDSEGSPSPPPTPKEKPLRTKRGHRKPSFLQNLHRDSPHSNIAFLPAQTAGQVGSGSQAGGNGAGQALTVSPSNSDAFSHKDTQSSLPAPRPLAAAPNGHGNKPPSGAEGMKKPRNPFELFVAENRGIFKGTTFDVDKELAIKWQEMGHDGQYPYHVRYEGGDYNSFGEPSGPQRAAAGADRRAVDVNEDVEMGEEGDDDES